MTETTTTKWECDRCGRTFKADPNKQPSAWGYLLTATPPKANPTETTRRHLCPACVDDLARWFKNEKTPKKPHKPSATPTEPGHYLSPCGELWTLHAGTRQWFNSGDGSVSVLYATGEVETLEFFSKPSILLVPASTTGREA